jgi:hypothetical protein
MCLLKARDLLLLKTLRRSVMMIIVMPLIVLILRWRRMMITVMAIIMVIDGYGNRYLLDFRTAAQSHHGHRSQQYAGQKLWSNHRLSLRLK